MGKLSRIHQCPRVAIFMECPECGYTKFEADSPLDEGIPHNDPYLEIGPKEGPSLRVSLLWIPGAGTGTS